MDDFAGDNAPGPCVSDAPAVISFKSSLAGNNAVNTALDYTVEDAIVLTSESLVGDAPAIGSLKSNVAGVDSAVEARDAAYGDSDRAAGDDVVVEQAVGSTTGALSF